MADYLTYRVRVTTLAPLHIGSGQMLLNEFDYAIKKGRTWRLREEAILEAQDIEDRRLLERLLRTPPAHLLKDDDYREDAPFFRYVLRGTPRATGEGAQLQEQIKDVYDRPYLPGSSLKGALRTVLGWHAWAKLGLRAEPGRLAPNPRWAASRYEKDIFGPDPNHDLLRALHVSDSRPLGPEALMVVNVRVVNRRGNLGPPVEVEAVRPNVTFELEMKLDLALFSDWAGRRGLERRGRAWLEALPEIAREHSRRRMEAEREWAAGVEGARRLADAYRTLLGALENPAGFPLQVGWGTGWESKTFGSHLKANPALMRVLLRPRREKGYGVARGRPPADPTAFPASRRVAVSVQRDRQGRPVEAPAAPLGWVWVQMEPAG